MFAQKKRAIVSRLRGVILLFVLLLALDLKGQLRPLRVVSRDEPAKIYYVGQAFTLNLKQPVGPNVQARILLSKCLL